MNREEWFAQLFTRLGNSKFRTSFKLEQKDIDYMHEKELERYGETKEEKES